VPKVLVESHLEVHPVTALAATERRRSVRRSPNVVIGARPADAGRDDPHLLVVSLLAQDRAPSLVKTWWHPAPMSHARVRFRPPETVAAPRSSEVLTRSTFPLEDPIQSG
jgi:hypothetical protein